MSEVKSPQLEAATTSLAKLIQEAHPCDLEPLCFFVSWQGVLTLAYRSANPGAAVKGRGQRAAYKHDYITDCSKKPAVQGFPKGSD